MSETSRPRILIADDREENRYILSRVLGGAGFECLHAKTGYQAIEISLTLPDVIVLDVNLPDISGYEACRRIKQDPRTASISVLQISASFVSPDDRVRALEAGADGYLLHPIDSMVLVATVRALLRLRRAETQARKTVDQWQSTFDAMLQGLAIIGSDGRLIRWNAAFAEICHPKVQIDQNQDAAQLLESLVGTSDPVRQPEPPREFQVAKRTIQVHVNPVNTQTGEALLILTDVTDRNLAEYALRTAERLAATGKLANAIAHEINNPLETLTNLVYLAQKSSADQTTTDLLSQASNELGRIARITKQSLAFYRDSQKPIPIDVGKLVTEVASLSERSVAQRRVRISCAAEPTVTVCGFPGQLSQVFSNLIRNAAEASPAGSDVVVRVRSTHRGDHEGARVSIHDRGPGIPEEIRDRLFDPFFTTKGLKGSGLGLWVSRTILLRHHGTIRFRSSVREGSTGTTFEVFLPTNEMIASA
ncbi:MAG TPA: ATP-binding protein [Terracidiphilus sp.]|jgi:signal transduction histidine kinase